MTQITNAFIRTFDPCYDPSMYIKDTETLSVVDFLKKEEIPPGDRLWVVLRTKVVDEKTLRLHAVKCGRYALERLSDRAFAANISTLLDVSEKYALGQVDDAARSAAYSAAYSAADSAADSAARLAARSAAYSAAYSAADSAAYSAARLAARSAAYSAADSASYSAADSAAVSFLVELLTPITDVVTAASANSTLPTESKARKQYPLHSGCIRYFPAALAGVAKTSKLGNDKHNPGEALHHARGKSMDHSDCIIRHLIDLEDLLAALERSEAPATALGTEQILSEVNSLAWRALALSQELHEKLAGAPLAPAAKESK